MSDVAGHGADARREGSPSTRQRSFLPKILLPKKNAGVYRNGCRCVDLSRRLERTSGRRAGSCQRCARPLNVAVVLEVALRLRRPGPAIALRRTLTFVLSEIWRITKPRSSSSAVMRPKMPPLVMHLVALLELREHLLRLLLLLAHRRDQEEIEDDEDEDHREELHEPSRGAARGRGGLEQLRQHSGGSYRTRLPEQGRLGRRRARTGSGSVRGGHRLARRLGPVPEPEEVLAEHAPDLRLRMPAAQELLGQLRQLRDVLETGRRVLDPVEVGAEAGRPAGRRPSGRARCGRRRAVQSASGYFTVVDELRDLRVALLRVVLVLRSATSAICGASARLRRPRRRRPTSGRGRAS